MVRATTGSSAPQVATIFSAVRETDCIVGLDGDDYLSGRAGADLISAGDGADTAVGSDDYDNIFGQEGNDRLYAAHLGVQVPQFPDSCDRSGELGTVLGPTETGNAASGLLAENFLSGGDGYDLLVGSDRVDNMHGEQRGDDIYGFGGADHLVGGRASDCLSGGPGNDDLNDADPNNEQPDDIDTLWGGSSSDQLDAADGDGLDTLNGGNSFFFNRCRRDPGDSVISCVPIP